MTEVTTKPRDTRWIALGVLFAGSLMIVLDSTIVNVALPYINADLGFSASALAWVVNAYLLSFGGFLLLGGRLGDLFGHRKMFLVGIGLFTLASLLCGLAFSQKTLIIARAIQGFGGAIVSAVSLSLVMTMFQEPWERAKAMGYFGFIAAGGGTIGVVLGGVLTEFLTWHWIFLVNIPIGIAVLLATFALVPHQKTESAPGELDVAGAITITVSLLLATYGVVNGNDAGWISYETFGLLGSAIALLTAFVFIESRVKSPLIPLGLFKLRNLTIANVIGVLWAGAMFAWFFLAALYLQAVLGYPPLQVGLAFLPGNLVMGAFSLGLSAWIVQKFGIRRPLSFGLILAAAGLLWLARVPVAGTYFDDVLPSMILLGIGAGIAFNPVLLAAMSDVKAQDAGLASGVVNTSFMMGGALGLAILASVAASATMHALGGGQNQLEALTSGYHAAFIMGAVAALLAAVLAAVGLKKFSLSSVMEAHSVH